MKQLKVVFEEGIPYRSSDYNQVTDLSIEVATAWPSDHGPTNRHDPVRFEKGIACWRWNPFFNRYDEHSIDGVSTASMMLPTGYYRLSVYLHEPFVSADHYGLIGTGNYNQILPELLDTKTTSSSSIMAPPGLVEVTAIVLGRRDR